MPTQPDGHCSQGQREVPASAGAVPTPPAAGEERGPLPPKGRTSSRHGCPGPPRPPCVPPRVCRLPALLSFSAAAWPEPPAPGPAPCHRPPRSPPPPRPRPPPVTAPPPPPDAPPTASGFSLARAATRRAAEPGCGGGGGAGDLTPLSLKQGCRFAAGAPRTLLASACLCPQGPDLSWVSHRLVPGPSVSSGLLRRDAGLRPAPARPAAACSLPAQGCSRPSEASRGSAAVYLPPSRAAGPLHRSVPASGLPTAGRPAPQARNACLHLTAGEPWDQRGSQLASSHTASRGGQGHSVYYAQRRHPEAIHEQDVLIPLGVRRVRTGVGIKVGLLFPRIKGRIWLAIEQCWLLIEGNREQHTVINTNETNNCALFLCSLFQFLNCPTVLLPVSLSSTFTEHLLYANHGWKTQRQLRPLRGSGFWKKTDSGRWEGRLATRPAGTGRAPQAAPPSSVLGEVARLWPGQVLLQFSVPVMWTETVTHLLRKAAPAA